MNIHVMNGAAMNGDVIQGIYVPPNARRVYQLTAGVNNIRPMVRGTSAIVVLENWGNVKDWMAESVRGVSRDAGRRRK